MATYLFAAAAALIASAAATLVKRVPWSEAALRDAMARRMPLILTGAPSTAWRARTRWHAEAPRSGRTASSQAFVPSAALRTHIPFVRDALYGEVNWNWDRERVLCDASRRARARFAETIAGQAGGDVAAASATALLLPPPIDACTVDRPVGAKPRFNVSLEDFGRRITTRRDSWTGRSATSAVRSLPLLYMGQIVDEFAPVAGDIAGWRSLAAREDRGLRAHDDVLRDEAVCHIWIGASGVTTHTHYDMSHNVYAPIGMIIYYYFRSYLSLDSHLILF